MAGTAEILQPLLMHWNFPEREVNSDPAKEPVEEGQWLCGCVCPRYLVEVTPAWRGSLGPGLCGRQVLHGSLSLVASGDQL